MFFWANKLEKNLTILLTGIRGILSGNRKKNTLYNDVEKRSR